MSNSWDAYYAHYSDWDEAHCFNVRLELKFEEQLKGLGYVQFDDSEDLFLLDYNISNKILQKVRLTLKIRMKS